MENRFYNDLYALQNSNQNNLEGNMDTVFKVGIGILGLLATVLLFKENDKKTVSETDNKTDNKPQKQFKRGDRFVCEETGEELQVRAVGGRPRKECNF